MVSRPIGGGANDRDGAVRCLRCAGAADVSQARLQLLVAGSQFDSVTVPAMAGSAKS